EGGITPEDIAVAIGGALIGGAVGGLTEGGDDEEDKKKKPSRYKMYISKHFDNVIRKGQDPKPVYARNVEIPYGHGEIDRPDLTEQIQVFSGDYVLNVSDGGMSGGYKVAMVSADASCAMQEGTVSFRFNGKGGIYTRHVVFRLSDLAVIFLQPNLGLPANHEDTERLPFGILGVPEENMELTVEFRDKTYTVTGVEREPEAKDFPLYYASIKEAKPEKDPEKQDDPGATTTHYLHIEAKSPSPFPGEPDIKVEAEFPVHRVQLGLSLIMESDTIGCYPKKREGAVEQARMRAAGSELAESISVPDVLSLNAVNAMAASGVAALTKSTFSSNLKDEDVVPCVTEGRLMLLEWDEEHHQLIRVAVPGKVEDMKVTAKATLLVSDRVGHAGTPDEAHQALVDSLGIDGFPTGKADERGRLIRFCATKARLDPPTRLRADITVTVQYEKKEYQVTRNVLLHSMPIRHWNTDEEYREMVKWDNHVREYLTHVQKEIYEKYLYNLISMHDLIERMLEGYDERFGYNKNQLDNLMEVWTGFLEGKHTGARGTAERLTLADDLAAAYAFLQGMRDNGGWLGRIALGVCTAGYSEMVFFAMDLGEKMQQAVFACKGDEFGFWDGVLMGVKEYEKQLLTEFVVMGAAKLGSGFVRQTTGIDLGLTLQEAGKKYRAAMDQMDNALKSRLTQLGVNTKNLLNIKRFFNKSAGDCADALRKEQRLNNAAKQRADTIANRRQGKVGPDMTPEEIKLQTDYDEGMAEGMHKVRKLMEAQKELAVSRGKGTYWECKAKYEAAARDVWIDKNALKQLKRLEHPYATNMRAEFNAYRNRVKQRTTEKLLDDIALETGKRREDLFVQSASSNDAFDEIAGRKVPEDWDVTVREHVNPDPGTPVKAGPDADGVYDVMPTNLDPKKQVVMKQTASENALARNLYKEMYGVDPPSLEEAMRAMKEADVTYVSPWGDQGYVIEPNLEAYADLPGMIDKSQFGRELNGLALNRKTFEYKGNEWYSRADKCLEDAVRLELNLSNAVEKSAVESQIKALRRQAQSYYVEGTRQITKQVTKIANPRNTYHMAKGGSDMFSQQAREIHELALKVGENMSPAEFFYILRKDYGIDKYAYTEMMSKCLI
ncbi:MAG: hypothetical protein J6P31_05655, partial [Oscillospiraceae bacterium]|nr:hypothetical protein [Oscillospiraceae bacterium]